MIHLDQVKKKKLIDGIVGQYVHGETTTFGLVHIEEGSHLPLHHHPHEQVTFMLEGKLKMQIGDEEVILETGHVKVIPSNTPHSAVALSACKLIDVFSPVREDYRE
jgi:quercetin dioxygenase-like cupin family protein